MVVALVLMMANTCWAEVEINIPVIIQIESSGNPYAISKDGCIGLMQISQSVIDEFNERYSKQEYYYVKGELFDYCNNVKIGSWYIQQRIPQMLNRIGIPDTVDNRIIAYNWGIGNLYKYFKGEKHLPRETLNYIKKYHQLTKEK
jgi:soluble lytic murein transglycosylase-like protein